MLLFNVNSILFHQKLSSTNDNVDVGNVRDVKMQICEYANTFSVYYRVSWKCTFTRKKLKSTDRKFDTTFWYYFYECAIYLLITPIDFMSLRHPTSKDSFTHWGPFTTCLSCFIMPWGSNVIFQCPFWDWKSMLRSVKDKHRTAGGACRFLRNTPQWNVFKISSFFFWSLWLH